jgi:hypothetical protein
MWVGAWARRAHTPVFIQEQELRTLQVASFEHRSSGHQTLELRE